MKILMTLLLLCSATSYAAQKKKVFPNPEPTPVATPATDASKDVSPEGETVDVSKVTEKYWAQGKDTELGVVQNRKYTSEHRFELDLFTGTVSTDPFLTVHHYGGSLGYYFSQYFSAHAVAWSNSTSFSDAYYSVKLQTSNAGSTTQVNVNKLKSFYGLELDQNFLYGKASLFGHAIIYVDIFALGGLGFMGTDTGTNFTPFVGIGQKIHINQTLALNLDYRIMHFNETIPNTNVGGSPHDRSNYTDVVTLGLCIFY